MNAHYLLLIPALAAASTAAQAASQFNTLYHFHSQREGPSYAVPALGKDGSLYGTTLHNVFQLTPPAAPATEWTYTELYRFPEAAPSSGAGSGCAGSLPIGTPVVIGGKGEIYGSTDHGGTTAAGNAGCGFVFMLTPPPAPGGAWTETTLYTFAGTPDGGGGEGALLIGKDGSLYGTTAAGGTFGQGTVFRLMPPSQTGAAWTEIVLYSFAGYPTDGAQPAGGLTLGSDGSLYGTTSAGGTACDFCGTVFSLAPPSVRGGIWTETLLFSFFYNAPGDGLAPYSGVVFGKHGELYGTCFAGGDIVREFPRGTVFELLPPSAPGGAWSESVIHVFNYWNGASPYTGVFVAEDGSLYGVAHNGGRAPADIESRNGKGNIYRLIPPAMPGGAWSEYVLYNFEGSNGGDPYGLTPGPNGVFYGTTGEADSASHRFGTVFQIVR